MNATPLKKATKRRRSRPTVNEKIARSLRTLQQLRDAEWMVTPDWCQPAERHAILDAVDSLLSSAWAQAYLKAKND